MQANRRPLMEVAKVGKRGAIVVPVRLRKEYGIEEGALVTTEARQDGILIRPAVVVPVERYTPERKAEFLLSTATSNADYRKARKEVRKLGIDPDAIPHRRP
jgi:bifunctional DNA-binding transcriptional regulator/antitoxin component of YhaV-PrlF toxin-antitoxin module